jgi:ADP-ribose pyrophosphatase YjhB (NUDIX family)
VAEEAGVVAAVRGLIGVQELPDPWSGWNAFVYMCEHVHGEPVPDGHETDAAQYLTFDQLTEAERVVEPWSLWLMKRTLSKDVTIIEPSASNPFHPSPGFL